MSRQAIKNSLPIKTPYAINISNVIINKLKNNLQIEACTLGSLGKKLDYEESGDIDIAINYDFTKENCDNIISFINTNFSKYGTPEIYISQGFKIISFGYYYLNYDSYIDSHIKDDTNYYIDTTAINDQEILQIAQVDLMFSHINSVPRKSLGGKTPYEAFSFFYGENILSKLNIQKIEKDKVTLQPYLLKNTK